MAKLRKRTRRTSSPRRAPKPIDPRCNHTLRHTDDDTSYHIVSDYGGDKVVCKYCGRFYGRMRATTR